MAENASKPKGGLNISGLWVAIFIFLLVGAHELFGLINRPHHLDAIAEEIGNLSCMVKNEGVWKNGKLQLNHAGTKILFCESSEKGMGVFWADIAGGNKKMVFEEKEICFGQGPHGVLKVYPWSPDDRRFVYGHQGQGAANGDYDCANETILSVYNANTDAEEAALDIPYGEVAELDWLNEDAFVCASGTDGQNFYLAKRKTNGQWQLTALKKPTTGPDTADNQFCSFAAVSSNTIAWLQGNNIWTLNVESGVVSKLVELPHDSASETTYTSFDYSIASRQLLVACVDNKEDALWQLPLDSPQDLTEIASSKRRTHSKTWNDAVWINGGKEFAYIVPSSDSAGLVVQNIGGGDPITYFRQRKIQYFTASPDGNHFYIVGDVGNGIGADIWDYDTQLQVLRCVIPASGSPLHYSKKIEPRVTSVKLPDSKTANVIIYPPADYNQRSPKREPMVVTSIGFDAAQPYISQYAEAVANAGGYFVIVDRPWNFRTEEGFIHWEEAINCAMTNLLETQVLSIDKNRIFALSNSAQSVALMNVLTNHPSLYRGAICLVPSSLVEPSELEIGRKPFKILVSTQAGAGGDLPTYQDGAFKVGIAMNFIVHPGTPHEFIAKQSQQDRIKAILHFIFDN